MLENTGFVFRRLIDSVTDYAIYILDPNGYIMSWNTGAERLKGYKANEIIGRHFSTFYTQYDINRQHPEFELKQAFLCGKFEEEGWRIKKNGDVFWANVIINKMEDENGNFIGFTKVTRDLSERKENERKLKELNENLEKKVHERTQELELALKIKENFLSIVSHELKSPLTSLKLRIQLRLRKFEKGIKLSEEAFVKTLKDDENQIHLLDRLVDDILDTTRINMGKLALKKEEVELCSLIDHCIENFHLQIETSQITLSKDCSKEILGHWDAYRLTQVFTNLLNNAVKYGDEKPIHINVRATKEHAIITIKDNGIGISAEDQTRLFQQFERATTVNATKGLGLGLYITKEIVKGHQGTINLDSSPNEGSTFTVMLPLH